MEVAFLSQYSGINPRGAETFIFELGNRLHKLGLNVRVFQNGPPLSGSLYHTIQIKNTSSAKFTHIALNTIKHTDVLFPINGRIQVVFSSLWAKTHGTKLVISGQSGIGWDDRVNLWTMPNVFVGLTNYQCKWAKKANPLVRIENIPNGVDQNKFYAGKSKIKINLPRPLVLNVGAFTPIKRQAELIKAVAKTSASLLLVGDGPLKTQLQALGRKLLPGRLAVKSLGYEHMPDVYRSCDLFAYPCAAYESFGIAMLEALATNLPVVATDDPIRREIVGLAGTFTDPTNIDDFADTINATLTKNWDKIPLSQSQKFIWDKIADKYIQLFKSI